MSEEENPVNIETQVQEKYTTSSRSQAVNHLALALSKAQGEMKSAPKNKTNPHLKSKYADLASVIDTARPALTGNGLSFVQIVECDGPKIICYTELLHTSGQWIRGKLVLHAAQTAIQQIGAGITYAKRYALSAMLGIASDEEDDGEAEQAKAKESKPVSGKYKQISVSDPVPVDDEPVTLKEHKEFVEKAKEIIPGKVVDEKTLDQPASDDLKNMQWTRCKILWPIGTKDACEVFCKDQKMPEINWKIATIGDMKKLGKLLDIAENLAEGGESSEQ